MRTTKTEGLIDERVKYRSEYFQTKKFEYGLTCIPGRANEDTYSIYVHDETSAAFGVYDGHGGLFGSTLCSNSFCKTTLENVEKYCTLFEAHGGEKIECDSDNFDALFCESVRNSTDDISKEIKRQGKTGTTNVSLFVKSISNGRTKIFCSNTGDSRCVMLRNHQQLFMSEDHNLSLPREIDRIIMKRPVEWYPLPGDPRLLSWNMKQDQRDPIDGESVSWGTMQIQAESIECYPSKDRLLRASAVVAMLELDEDQGKSINISTATSNLKRAAKTDTQKESGNILMSYINSMMASSNLAFFPSTASTDGLDDTIHNIPSAMLTDHAHHKDLILKVHGEGDLVSTAGGLVLTLSSTPQNSPINSSPQASPTRVGTAVVKKVANEIIYSLVKELFRVCDAASVSFWNSDKKGAGDEIDSSVAAEKLSLCCVMVDEGDNTVDYEYDEVAIEQCSAARKVVHGNGGIAPEGQTSAAITGRMKSVCVPILNPFTQSLIGVVHIVARSGEDDRLSYSAEDVAFIKIMCDQSAQALVFPTKRNSSVDSLSVLSHSCISTDTVDETVAIRRPSSIELMAVSSSPPEPTSSRANLSSPSSTVRTTREFFPELSSVDSSLISFRSDGSDWPQASSPSPSSAVMANKAELVDTPEIVLGRALVYKHSFIAQRVIPQPANKMGSGGKRPPPRKGPKALFSRHNVSITMTRSLGDRYAARSCVNIPEITAIVIDANEHAR